MKGRKKVVKIRSIQESDISVDDAAAILDSFRQSDPVPDLSELFQVRLNEIRVRGSLGKGVDGSTVYKAEWNFEVVSLKCYEIDETLSSPESIADFVREAETYSKIRDPNILRLYGCILRPPQLGLLFEFCEYGDLLDFLLMNPELPTHQRFRIMLQGAAAIRHLHQRSIIHRSLKLENVLINNNMNVKFMEFIGPAIDMISSPKRRVIGSSPQYLAPETMDGRGEVGEKVDVYSFAIMLYQMLTNKQHVFGQKKAHQAHLLARRGDRPDLAEIEALCPLPILDEVKGFIETMWDQDPAQRPSMSVVREKMESFMESTPEEAVRITVDQGVYVPGEARKMPPAASTSGGRRSRRRRARQQRTAAATPAARAQAEPAEESESQAPVEETGPTIKLLFRHSRMVKDFTMPHELPRSEMTIDGLRRAFGKTLGLRPESLQDLRKNTRQRLMRLNKDASVRRLKPETIVVAVLPED